MANLALNGDKIPKNTQEGDGVIVRHILPAKKRVFVERIPAVEARDTGLEEESEDFKENGNNGSKEEPRTTINQGSESVRRGSIPLEFSIDEMQVADAFMKLKEKTIEEVIQEGTLDEKMALLRTIFSGIHEEEKEYEKLIAKLTREIETFKIHNWKLKSETEEVKAKIVTLKGEQKVLEESLASLEEDLKKEEQKYDDGSLQYRIKWLETESDLLDQQSRFEEDMKMNLQNELEAKRAQISFFLLELETETAESEELKALKEEEAEMQKKMESCKETIRCLIDATVKFKREDEKKVEKIESMAKSQNEWIINTHNRINNLRESFVEMRAIICDEVNDLTEKISNLIHQVAGNHRKPPASIFDDKVGVASQEMPLESPSTDLVVTENSFSLNSTAEENLQESTASIDEHRVRTVLQVNGLSEDQKIVIQMNVAAHG